MKLRWFLSAIVIGLFLAACTAAPTPATQLTPSATAPESTGAAGQIIVGETAFWSDLNPLTLVDAKGLHLFVNEPLISYSREDWSVMVPALAESWDVSDDGLTYTFHLRQGVQFTDGQPFTSADVKFTFDTAMDPATGYAGTAALSSIAAVEAADDFTITITLNAPSAVFLSSLSRFGIVPKHILEGADLATTDFRQFPVGTGPFIVTEHDAEFLTLEANPAYWGAPAGTAKIIFKTAPDAAARSAMLRSGDIDLTRYEYQTQGDLVGNGFHVSRAATPGWLSCEINHRNPLFADARVRQAMMYALDREAILKAAYQDNATVASGPVTSGDWSYSADVQQYTYDVDKAAELMTEAGWAKNSQGIWEKDGQPFAFVIMAYQPNPSVFNTNLALQQYWKEIGMDVAVDVTPDWATWWDRYIAGDFDAAVMDWAYGTDPDGLSASFETGGALSGTGYSNAALDALLAEGRTTLDRDARKGIYAQAQTILAEDLPVLWLAWQYRGIIMKDGIDATYDPIGDFYANAYWWTVK